MNTPEIRSAAERARKLLHRLTGVVTIDDTLLAEIVASEQALWDALYPAVRAGARP